MSNDFPTFPALGFRRDVGRNAIPGRERLAWFVNAEHFSTCTSWTLKHGERLGMELVDSAGRSWRVARVVDLGVTGPFWERVLRRLVQQSLYRLKQELVELEPLSLAQVKARACASIQANPDDWRDDEAIAGEDGPPQEEQDLLDALKSAVQDAECLPRLIDVLFRPDLAV